MSESSKFEIKRSRMVEDQLIPRGVTDPRVLEVMRSVPRHLFVDDALQAKAYGDYPLPIGGGQTISQPYIVGLMTQALELQGNERVLEIGTGSGYQAVVLSRLCKQVYTIERVTSLLARARRIFDRLHCHNIISRLDDGTVGWPQEAPFDAIMVTAGGPEIPKPLIDQLTDPGRMVMPVGDQFVQELKVITKKEGEITSRTLERVRFVNLIGVHGWEN